MAIKELDIAMEQTSQEILALIGQGITAKVVKSIQHQCVEVRGSNVSSFSTTFTIAEVDVNKCQIIVNGGSSGDGIAMFAALQEFTSTTVTVVGKASMGINNSGWVSICVIEYY